MEVGYFHGYIDGVDFVFLDAPCFRHIGQAIYGGSQEVLSLSLFLLLSFLSSSFLLSSVCLFDCFAMFAFELHPRRFPSHSSIFFVSGDSKEVHPPM